MMFGDAWAAVDDLDHSAVAHGDLDDLTNRRIAKRVFDQVPHAFLQGAGIPHHMNRALRAFKGEVAKAKVIRDSLTQISATYPVDQIAGPKKAELIAKAEARTRAFFLPFGLNVERLYWASNIRLPDQVRGQIEQKIANEQGALAAEAQVATVKAQAQQRVAQAQGEAEALSVQGSALRANPEVLRLKAIEKWDGKLPATMIPGGAIPMLKLTNQAAAR